MHDRQQLGAHGEALAADHLRAAGHEILHRNWRSSVEGVRGELDLVTRDRDTLVVVEVKTRRSTLAGTASEAVGWQKRRRLRRLTGLYLAEHPHRGPVRGDVVALDLADDGRWAITHHRGVW